MRRLTRAQDGWAMVLAILVMVAVLSMGLAALALVDGTQKRSGEERVGETSFNLAEAAMTNQTLLLSNRWPSSSATAYPSSCTRTSTATGCPDATTLVAGFSNTDVNTASTWTVTVRDDLGSAASYYSRSVLDSTTCAGGGAAPCSWDSNRNGTLWVRAQATVNGKTRTLVALVKLQTIRLSLPRNAITAGHFSTNNNGLKTIVDEKGCQAKSRPSQNCNATQPAPIAVRCTTATPGVSGDSCLGYRSVQVAPNNYIMGYGGNVLTPTQLSQMKSYAQQQGTYYTACPTAAQLAGSMVYVDGASCSYTGGTYNSSSAPGVLVVDRGTLTLGGSSTYYGLIYMANNLVPPADAGNILVLTGTAYVQGAVFVEGNGGVLAGASGLNIAFDEAALGNVLGLSGNAGIAQNSFRELTSGQ
jgi:Tfp pilus assembly protein PilX